MDPGSEPPALFTLPAQREPLREFHRRMRHHRPAPGPVDPLQAWAARHAGTRGRSPSGTVHLLTGDWLPVCGAGLNGWDFRELQPTDDDVSCGRCGGVIRNQRPNKDQLALF